MTTFPIVYKNELAFSVVQRLISYACGASLRRSARNIFPSSSLQFCSPFPSYISRKTGLKKGVLVVTLHPSMSSKLDSMTSKMNGVSISPGKGSRYISSSNYRGFDSKGYSPQLTSNEHQAVAYKVDVSGGFSTLKSFLKVC
jgi:hypothetical protein